MHLLWGLKFTGDESMPTDMQKHDPKNIVWVHRNDIQFEIIWGNNWSTTLPAEYVTKSIIPTKTSNQQPLMVFVKICFSNRD